MEWVLGSDGETAIGPVVPVIAGDRVVASLCASWSDEDGVRVSVADDGVLDDLSGAEARVLAAALVELAGIEPPR